MKLNIRFATLDDFELVRRFDPHSKYIDPEKIRSKLGAEEIILAFDGEKPVGIIKFSYFWATRPYMDLIWVLPDYRKQGVGLQLLGYLEEYLRDNGYTYLMTSSEKHETAPQDWHKRQGFLPCGELAALNLPDDDTSEVFFYKRIATGDPKHDALKEYPIL